MQPQIYATREERNFPSAKFRRLLENPGPDELHGFTPSPRPTITPEAIVTEPHDLWISRASAKWKDLVPQVKNVDGKPHWVYEGDQIRQVGEDNVLYESDFPHPTCLYPNAVQRTFEGLKDVDPAVVKKVMSTNAAKLYNIPI